jgi:hypothetical protein
MYVYIYLFIYLNIHRYMDTYMEGDVLMSMHTDGSEESKIRQTTPSIMDRWLHL